MAENFKKEIILKFLNQEIEPIDLPSLLKKLGTGYVERSVRRWLAELIEENKIKKIGQKRGTKYQAIIVKTDSISLKISSNLPSNNFSKDLFSQESIELIKKIRKPIYERIPKTYNDEWLESYNPNETFYLSESIRAQLQKAGQRSRKEDPAGTYAHQIYNRLLIDLSYNSSRLEGNTYSLLETERLLLEGSSAEGKLEEEKIMILNHKEAIRYLVDNAPKLDVSERTICTFHFLLSEGLVESRYSGKIREYAVRVGGSTYIPFEDKRDIQKRFDKIILKASQIENPFEQSFFILIHLSYLQAFVDVNKRTARLGANISLVKANLVPQSFNGIERDDYTSALLTIYEFQDVRPFTDLYLYSYLRTCLLYDATVKALGFDEIRVRYRSQRRAMLRHIILNHLRGEPLKDYISLMIKAQVKKEDQPNFEEDLLEDIAELHPNRIEGLGITIEDLESYQNSI